MLALTIGTALCKVLPAVQTLMECDYTSKVGTMQTALEVNSHYIGMISERTKMIQTETMIEKVKSISLRFCKKRYSMHDNGSVDGSNVSSEDWCFLRQLTLTIHEINFLILRAYFAT